MDSAEFFEIFVLLVAIIMLIYVVAVAVYFWHGSNTRPLTKTEATFLFWATIIMGILLIILGIWAVIRIFSHSVIVTPTVTTVPVAPTVTTVPVAPTTGHTPIQIVATHS